MFSDCEIDIVDGHRVLGSVIGAEHTCADFIAEQSNAFIKLLRKLTVIAKSSPQNAFKALTNGIEHKLTFIARTTPLSREPLESAETVIAKELIPALVSNTAYNEKFRL